MRIGIAFEPTLESLRAAVGQATSIWAGRYAPLLPGNADWTHDAARVLSVDVICDIDGRAHNDLVKTPGWIWRGGGPWGPLSPPMEHQSRRLISPAFVLASSADHTFMLPRWDDDDPLSDLFRVWFGQYPADEVCDKQARALFEGLSTDVLLNQGARVPDISEHVTPIDATALGMDYSAIYPGFGFVIVTPGNVNDLIRFWNLRASGADVFPWPTAHGSRLSEAAVSWVHGAVERTRSKFSDASGADQKLRVEVWPGDQAIGLPEDLVELLASLNVEHWRGGSERSYGWNGQHPFSTDHFEYVLAPTRRDGMVADVPIPRLPVGRIFRESHKGSFAVDIEISGVDKIRPAATYGVPNIRSMSRLLWKYDDYNALFARPTHSGRAMGIVVETEKITVSAIPTLEVMDEMLAPSQALRQNDNGVFAAQLVDRLGGLHSTLANQPGVREVLRSAAASSRGKSSGHLIAILRKGQGSWPDPLMHASIRRDYVGSAFRNLLATKILRPVLPLGCPYCKTRFSARPEDLSTDMACEMCLRTFPLGLALGLSLNGRNDWRYQLAGHIDLQRLSEVLPVMAAMHVLAGGRISDGPGMVPHVFGVEAEIAGIKGELDILAVHNDYGSPIVIVGEVKSRQDSIEREDVEKLAAIQRHVRSQGIECIVLAAVLRALSGPEVDLLRGLAETAMDSLTHRSVVPVFPIVLNEAILSIPESDDGHPRRRLAGYEGPLGLAEQTCRMVLGLEDVTSARKADGGYDLTWSQLD